MDLALCSAFMEGVPRYLGNLSLGNLTNRSDVELDSFKGDGRVLMFSCDCGDSKFFECCADCAKVGLTIAGADIS